MKKKKKSKILKLVMGSSIGMVTMALVIIIPCLMLLDFFGANITDDYVENNMDYADQYKSTLNKALKNGYGYETSKGVYFDTSKLENYGRMLSNNKIEDLKDGARIEVDKEKRTLTIIDNGIGIDQENISNIFKRFYRERKVHNIDGVGIGLYLSKNIIENQNGYIKVKSKVNKGTTFSVFLPL